MSAITNLSPALHDLSVEVLPAVAAVTLNGKNVVERRTNMLAGGITEAAAMSLAATKGKIGTAVREVLADAGMAKAIRMACNGTYLPLVQLFAFHTGISLTVSTKEEFNNLPFAINMLVEAERARSKTGGKKLDTKTGLEVDVPKVATLMGLQSLMTQAVAQAKEVHEQRQAKRLAQAAAQAEQAEAVAA